MRIDRKLNLVVPLYDDDAADSPAIAYVHSAPLSEQVVDRYFVPIGKTYSAIWEQGFSFASGPGHAARILRHIAEVNGTWEDGLDARGEKVVGVQNGLLAEIRRLTNVLVQADGEWRRLPWEVAVNQRAISEEDQREVENAVVFFIVAYATLNRSQRRVVLEKAGEIWGAQLTSSDFTGFGNSLKTSTATASTGASPPARAKRQHGLAGATVAGKPAQVPS